MGRHLMLPGRAVEPVTRAEERVRVFDSKLDAAHW
jgi:hypothetical protein